MKAAGALVIADGAVWIWRLAADRFPPARQRLDFYHAARHLAAVGRAVFGEESEKLKAWLKPLVRQLKSESAVKVIRPLEELLQTLPAGTAAPAGGGARAQAAGGSAPANVVGFDGVSFHARQNGPVEQG